MKLLVRIIQVIVGVLFIVSGLVKANDPLSLAYKMEEFFTVWTDSLSTGHFFAKNALIQLFHFLNGYTLALAIVMITLEILAGVALLIGWRKKLVIYLLLLLIVFFTFLTGYAYLAKNVNGDPKFTNCGCFGDCLPITPFTSFLKDIALTVMIIILVIGQKYIQPAFSKRIRTITILSSLVAVLLMQWYVLHYLPFADCLPLKKGNNISEQMKPPKNAIPSVYETRLVYLNKKTGALRDMSQTEFNNSKIWEDTLTWKWKETNTKLVRRGTDIPKLQNFSLTTSTGFDTATAILSDSSYSMLYFVDPKNRESKTIDRNLLKKINEKSIPVTIVTTNRNAFANEAYPVVTCDGTVFRIAARVNPTIYLLKHGTIINKWPLARKNAILQSINDLKK